MRNPAPSKFKLTQFKRACDARGLPYTSMRDQAHRGAFPILKVGPRWYVDDADFDRWIERNKARLIDAPDGP